MRNNELYWSGLICVNKMIGGLYYIIFKNGLSCFGALYLF